MRYSVHMVGVGGQGVLLASMVIGTAAMEQGLEVAMSEVHGMAQRGGSVASTLRMGERVLSPLIPKGGADLILGFEPIEAYRALEFASATTYIVTNTHPVIPVTVSMGMDEYPEVEAVIEDMKRLTPRIIPIDATSKAIDAGKAIAANSVLLGAISAVKGFPLKRESMERALMERVPDRFVELNRKAFQLGCDEVMGQMLSIGPDHPVSAE